MSFTFIVSYVLFNFTLFILLKRIIFKKLQIKNYHTLLTHINNNNQTHVHTDTDPPLNIPTHTNTNTIVIYVAMYSGLRLVLLANANVVFTTLVVLGYFLVVLCRCSLLMEANN